VELWGDGNAGQCQPPLVLVLDKYSRPMRGPRNLTAARLQQFCTEKIDAGCSARTVELSHLNISQALDQAVALGWVSRNVADVVKPPRGKPKEMDTWGVEDSMRFLAVAAQSTYGPVWLLALTKGLRKGELLGVRWQDIDLERGILRVRQTVGSLRGKVVIRGTKTPKSRRDVDLWGGVLAALRAHKVRQNERRLEMGSSWQEGYDLVFTCENGGPIHPDNLDRDYDRWVKKAGVKRIRIHDLRHTYATLALANGENPKVVSETLGHADIAITLRVYTHVLPTQRHEMADRMERLFLGDQEAVG
jgi:integrase